MLLVRPEALSASECALCVPAEAGQLQLNTFEPVILYSLERPIAHLTPPA